MKKVPYKIQNKPLTKAQLKEWADPSGWVDDIVVKVDLSEIIESDLEGFLDLLGELVGSPLMQDISYHVVGHDDDTLHIEVHGDVSEDIDDDKDDNDED
jgi:hypothetical protein